MNCFCTKPFFLNQLIFEYTYYSRVNHSPHSPTYKFICLLTHLLIYPIQSSPSFATLWSHDVNYGLSICYVRQPPIKEQQAVSKFIGYLVTCDVGLWPTETLVHPYWAQTEHRILEGFNRCREHRANATNSLKPCHRLTTPYCGQRSAYLFTGQFA